MELRNENYRPVNVEFDVATSGNVPERLGFYETGDLAIAFMHKHLLCINQKLSVYRFIDNHEKAEIRRSYNDLLENKVPMLERELQKAKSEFEEAKKNLSNAIEAVNATVTETKALAMEVKRGIKDMNLDDKYTWRVPVHGMYYFFTYMDKVIKLCKTQVIPDYEKMDVFNDCTKNELFFNDNEPAPEDFDNATSFKVKAPLLLETQNEEVNANEITDVDFEEVPVE